MTTDLIFARYFATTEHVRLRGHTHGGLPYTHHLIAVEQVLRRFLSARPDQNGVLDLAQPGKWRLRNTEPLLVAAWLHDVVEDCPEIKVKHLMELFGEDVAGLVEAVTDEPGPNRKARKLATYEKIRGVPDAVILKLADRIANVEAGGHLVEMYRKEHPAFRHGLQNAVTTYPEVVAQMWAHLDSLLA